MDKEKITTSETPKYKAEWVLTKYADEEARRNDTPYEVKVINDNITLDEGVNELFTLICLGGTLFNAANAHIGVGDSSATENNTHTGLQAAVNKFYKGMVSGFPTYGTNRQAKWKSSFASGEANFAWNEATVANGNSDSAKNLNRKVQSMGTKASGAIWDLEVTITLNY